MDTQPSHPRLARRLGTGDAVVIGLGSMIGAGVFAAFAPAARAAGAGLLVGLAIAAVVAYCNATASAQRARASTGTGAQIVTPRDSTRVIRQVACDRSPPTDLRQINAPGLTWRVEVRASETAAPPSARAQEVPLPVLGFLAPPDRLQPQSSQEPVEQRSDGVEWRRTVQEVGDRAEQVAQQVARPRHRSDVQVNRSQVDDQTKQVQV